MAVYNGQPPGTKPGLRPLLFAGGKIDALQRCLLGGVTVDAVEVSLVKDRGVELGFEALGVPYPGPVDSLRSEHSVLLGAIARFE